MEMTQRAPFPASLDQIVRDLTLTNKPLWRFALRDQDRGQGSVGLTLFVWIDEQDAYHEDEKHRRVVHFFPVPPAAYDYGTWRRWVLDRLIEVQVHETCEGFELNGEHPYAPNHGPGRDPYTVFDYATDEQRRTKFTGEVKSA